MNDIEARVRKVISETLGVDHMSRFTPEDTIIGNLGADSLDTVEIVLVLEDELECDFSDDEAERVVTIQDAIDLVAKRTT
jgi:acyl carrier protein